MADEPDEQTLKPISGFDLFIKMSEEEFLDLVLDFHEEAQAYEELARGARRKRAAWLRIANRAGVSWAKLGKMLGVTRERARQMSEYGRE